MHECSNPPPRPVNAKELLATLWPLSAATDSDSQRRKKLAVRSGQLAMAVMVATAVGGTVAADYRQFTGWRVAALASAGLAYVGWSLRGTRHGVRALLWEGGAPTPPVRAPQVSWQTWFYFAVQLGLAGLIYFLGDQGGSTALLWLVLLPPVAHAVILLPPPGIATVSGLSVAILVFHVVRQHGWEPVPIGVLQFSFAVLFTLIFTLLAVSSEKARGEVQRLAGQLGEANRKLWEYAVQAEELAATRERNRLAREIHDSLGHYLTVVNVQIEAARAIQDHDPARARDALDKAQALTQEGLQEIRRSVAALRASPLDNKPLAGAVGQVVEASRAAGVAVEMQVLGEARVLSSQAELTLYRAAQEGLTNVRKHAHATRVNLDLDYRDPTKARLSVRDDGQGATNGADTAGGFGLLGLRERAQILGGVVRVQTAPNAGFTLEVEVPG